jgi:hypothetical protein
VSARLIGGIIAAVAPAVVGPGICRWHRQDALRASAEPMEATAMETESAGLAGLLPFWILIAGGLLVAVTGWFDRDVRRTRVTSTDRTDRVVDPYATRR